jgi:tetratricopeptide (TPR) repeat protein
LSETPPRVGKITVLERLGEGGMGTVSLGWDERLKRRVALKSIHKELMREPELRARFLREAQILSRLRHPGICQIHDYLEGDESDTLVLEHIEGRSLAKAIRGGLPAGEKLRIALEIAEVLEAAHAAGVVHRDLKPENVMLDAGGRVKVLDFGIARVVDGTEAADAPGTPSAESSAPGVLPARPDSVPSWITSRAHTELGTVVGTFQYMSPEQARGEPATPRSDLYGFGLLLQELYTGRPAYPDDLPPRELLERVRLSRTEPPTGAPADVAQLLSRLLAREPEKRPTATEAAQALRRIRDAPRRRLRLFAIVSGTLLAVLAATRYVADVTSARRKADLARGQAERLVTFMLDDLYDELQPLGRRDFLARVSDETLRYFEELPPALRRGSEHRMARALRNVGRVKLQQGDLEASDKAMEQARRLDEQALATAGRTPEVLEGLASDLRGLGKVREFHGDGAAALEHYERSRDLLRELSQRSPGDPRRQEALAAAFATIGWCLRGRGDIPGALSAFDDAGRLYQALAARTDAKPAWLFQAAVADKVIAECRQLQGELDVARRTFESALVRYDRLLSCEHDVVEYLASSAETRAELGTVLQAQGDLPAAIAAYESALAVHRRAVAADPTDQRWPLLLGLAELYLGRAERLRGGEGAARAAFTRVVDLTRDAGPGSRLYLQGLRAQALLELGRVEEARPFVARLVAKEWDKNPDEKAFVELCRRHGLL